MTATMTPAATRILDAASRLFYERGITDVGVDLVAEEAGTTKKTLYDRFGSKDGLVVAYLEARLERWQAHVEDRLRDSGLTGARRVLAMLDALETWLADGTRGCGFINAYAELSTRSPAASAVVRREKAWIVDRYARTLVEAGYGRRPALARQLALVHEGAIVSLTAAGSARALDDARAVFRALLADVG